MYGNVPVRTTLSATMGECGFFAAQQADAARIHQRVGLAVPLGLRGDAVAGDPGLIVNNGDATSGDAVKQRGLAYVWSADNGDEP